MNFIHLHLYCCYHHKLHLDWQLRRLICIRHLELLYSSSWFQFIMLNFSHLHLKCYRETDVGRRQEQGSVKRRTAKQQAVVIYRSISQRCTLASTNHDQQTQEVHRQLRVQERRNVCIRLEFYADALADCKDELQLLEVQHRGDDLELQVQQQQPINQKSCRSTNNNNYPSILLHTCLRCICFTIRTASIVWCCVLIVSFFFINYYNSISSYYSSRWPKCASPSSLNLANFISLSRNSIKFNSISSYLLS